MQKVYGIKVCLKMLSDKKGGGLMKMLIWAAVIIFVDTSISTAVTIAACKMVYNAYYRRIIDVIVQIKQIQKILTDAGLIK